MKIKEEAAGETGGEQYEVLWDSDVGAFSEDLFGEGLGVLGAAAFVDVEAVGGA